MMDCTEKDGSPVALDPRHIVRTAVDRLAKLGYTATVATELEFYLCDESWEPVHSEIQCYGITKGAELEPILSDIRRKVEEFGIVGGGLQLGVRPVADRDQPQVRRPAAGRRRHGAVQVGGQGDRPRSTAAARRSCRSRSPASPATARTSTSRCAMRTAQRLRLEGPQRPVLHERADEALRRRPAAPPARAGRDRQPDHQRLQAVRGLLVRARPT